MVSRLKVPTSIFFDNKDIKKDQLSHKSVLSNHKSQETEELYCFYYYNKKGGILQMKMNEHNAKTIKDFCDYVIENMDDDNAIYFIESLKAVCDFAAKNPKKVADFVNRIKEAAAKEVMKNETKA